MAPRSANTPWLWLQTVTRCPSQRATAQLGAIEAWARYGRVNSAPMVRATAAAASSSCDSSTVTTCAGADSRNAFRSRSSGRDGVSSHRAAPATARADATAARSDGATTPRKEPSRTVTTPPGSGGSPSPARDAAGAGGRMTRPYSMPGRTRSCRNRGRPVTLSGMSSRAALRPATDHRAGGLGRLGHPPSGPAGRPRRGPPGWPATSRSARCRRRRSVISPSVTPSAPARRPAGPRRRPGTGDGPARTPGAAPSRTPRWSGCPR